MEYVTLFKRGKCYIWDGLDSKPSYVNLAIFCMFSFITNRIYIDCDFKSLNMIDNSINWPEFKMI